MAYQKPDTTYNLHNQLPTECTKSGSTSCLLNWFNCLCSSNIWIKIEGWTLNGGLRMSRRRKNSGPYSDSGIRDEKQKLSYLYEMLSYYYRQNLEFFKVLEVGCFFLTRSVVVLIKSRFSFWHSTRWRGHFYVIGHRGGNCTTDRQKYTRNLHLSMAGPI